MSATDLDLDNLDKSIQSFKLKKQNGHKKLMVCFPISGDTVLFVEDGVLQQAAHIRNAMRFEKQIIDLTCHPALINQTDAPETFETDITMSDEKKLSKICIESDDDSVSHMHNGFLMLAKKKRPLSKVEKHVLDGRPMFSIETEDTSKDLVLRPHKSLVSLAIVDQLSMMDKAFNEQISSLTSWPESSVCDE